MSDKPPGSVWVLHHEYYPYPAFALWDSLGAVPYMLEDGDERPAVAQFEGKYGGGWDTMPGFALLDGVSLKYPGDPPMHPIATCMFRTDTVLVYPFGWVCVKHADMTFEVARMN